MTTSVPYTFASQSGNVPARELDDNFASLEGQVSIPGSVVALVPGKDPLILQDAASDVRTIASVTDDGSNLMLVATDNPHGYTTGDSVFLRVGGFDGRTTRAHMANNWTGGPLVNPTTLKPDPAGIRLGGDAWTVTVVDPQSFTLDGSTWKVDPSDPDPVFFYGVSYKTLVDAWPIIDQAMTYIGDDPGILQLGFGFYVLGAGDTHLAWRPLGNITIQGQGQLQTTIFRGDYFNQTPWRFGSNNSTVRNLCQDGNRNFNGQGRHGWIFDGVVDDTSMYRCVMENVWTRGVSGYGTEDGINANKFYFHFYNCEWLNTNNSAIDVKGQNLSDPQAEFFVASKNIGNTFGFWSMGTVGDNKAVPVAMINNPVVTNTGNPHSVQVHLPVFASPGQRVNLNGLTPTGGITFGNNWFPVTFGSTFATIDVTPQTVTSNVSAGGGNAGMAWMPAFRNKGSAIEVRGGGWNLSNVSCRGWMGRHNGVSFLGGDGSNVNGYGGHYSTLNGYTSIDTTPTGLGYNSAVHLNLGAVGCVVGGAVLVGNGSGIGVLSGGNVSLNTCEARVSLMATGVSINADDTIFRVQMDSCTAGATVDGGSTFSTQTLPNNPFTLVSGSLNVNVHAPLFTGISAGDTIIIGGSHSDSSGTVNLNGNQIVVAIVDVNNFTVQLLLPAPESESFGGATAFIQISNTTHNVAGVTAELDMRTMGAGVGITISADVNDFTIRNSHYDGSGTALTNASNRPVLFSGMNTGGVGAGKVAWLPSASTMGAGARSVVNDANATTYASIVAGGGSNVLPVISDGTNWRIG